MHQASAKKSVPDEEMKLRTESLNVKHAKSPHRANLCGFPSLSKLSSVRSFWRHWDIGYPDIGTKPLKRFADTQNESEDVSKKRLRVWKTAAACIEAKAAIEGTSTIECAEQLEIERQERKCSLSFFIKQVLPALHSAIQTNPVPKSP